MTDFAAQRPEFEREVGGYLRAGTLKNHETVVTGIERAVPAFLGLFDGKNTGKMRVKLAAD
jgi:NADPH-dependent curcumin reductase CurA